MNAADPQTNPEPRAVDSLNFEQTMEELRAIVDQMERGDAKLDQALAAFERGAALRARAQALLEEAKLKIEMVSKNQQGDMQFEPFEEE